MHKLLIGGLLSSISMVSVASNGVLWQDNVSFNYYLTDFSNQNTQTLTHFDDSAWQLSGQGDFNQDGYPDLVWRNTLTGENQIQLIHDNPTFSKNITLNYVKNSAWQIKGIGDFNADGIADILWYNSSSGCQYAYMLDLTYPTHLFEGKALGCIANLNWKIQGVADLDNNHYADVIWRNTSDGQVYAHLYSNAAKPAVQRIARVADQQWEIAAITDLNADGNADLYWRHRNLGFNYGYLMQGSQILAQQLIGYVPVTYSNLGWQIKGSADSNGDQKNDILWQHNSTDAIVIHQMDGLQKTAQTAFTLPSDGQIKMGYNRCPVQELLPVLDCAVDALADCLNGEPIYLDCHGNQVQKRDLGQDITRLAGTWQQNIPSQEYALPSYRLSFDPSSHKVEYTQQYPDVKCHTTYTGRYQTGIVQHLKIALDEIILDDTKACISAASESKFTSEAIDLNSVYDFTLHGNQLTLIDTQGRHYKLTQESTIPDTDLGLLKQKMDVLVGDAYCENDNQCASIGYGYMPCGGPAAYLVYSNLNTDIQPLFTLAEQYTAISQQQQSSMVGICLFNPEPVLSCVNNHCIAN